MKRIVTLPEHVVSKIAAGEVIERPAFAVKELIENAIDAGSNVIEIHIEGAGIKKITVRDNGEGMSKEDLAVCFLPHTTSKLEDADGLMGIRTLGFRGEALSSLASIATVTIKSRQKDTVGGTFVKVKNGIHHETSSIGMPVGTTVQVEHLFSSVPARKKFLKSEKTEFRHITDVVSFFALSYPSIHFLLTHNKKTIFDLPAKGSDSDRVKSILGETMYDSLIPISSEDDYISVKGMLGKPQAALKRNLKQYVFINNRFVSDRLITLAVRESFGTLLPSSSTPVFLLKLTLPPEVVDVNVHPRKEHVSFSDPKYIFNAVKEAVSRTLSEHNLTFRLARFKYDTSEKLGETTSFAGQLLKQEVIRAENKSLGNVSESSQIVQHANTYIVALTADGLCLVDQHAAHERVLYEDFIKAFEKTKKQNESQSLEKPVTLKLSVSDSQLLDEYFPLFAKMGFEIEHFQGTGILIRSIPVVFNGRNVQKIMMDMLSDLQEGYDASSIDARSKRMLAFLSCRAAVKSGDPLSEKQMRKLMSQLEIAQNKETCPHGRPTSISVSSDQLDTLFRRR